MDWRIHKESTRQEAQHEATVAADLVGPSASWPLDGPLGPSQGFDRVPGTVVDSPHLALPRGACLWLRHAPAVRRQDAAATRLVAAGRVRIFSAACF